MPTSDIANIAPILDEVYRVQPERMIELGVGMGKYGVLCREVLDGIYGRCRTDQWARHIYGMEIHEPYSNPAWGCYDAVTICNFAEQDISGWDLVLMVDSLEHLESERGEKFLAHLVETNRHVIISVPNGPMPQDEAVFGNAHERHLTTYYGHEFNRYDPAILHLGLCRVVSMKGKRV